MLISIATFDKFEDGFFTGDGVGTTESINSCISSSGTSNFKSLTDSYLLYIGIVTLLIISKMLLFSEFGIIAERAVSSLSIAVALICCLY